MEKKTLYVDKSKYDKLEWWQKSQNIPGEVVKNWEIHIKHLPEEDVICGDFLTNLHRYNLIFE